MKDSDKQVFMDMTTNLAGLSKCASMHVASMLVNERGRVISTGINGSISGHDNCCELFDGPSDEHSAWSNDYEVHAEMNMILELARSSNTFSKGTVFCTHSPCPNCLKHILALQMKGVCQIDEIIFGTKYYKVSDESLAKQIQYAAKVGVLLTQHKPLEEVSVK